MLHSAGIAPLTPDVVAQLRAKHDALLPLEAGDSERLLSGSESLRVWGLCGDGVGALLLESGGVGVGTVATLAPRMGGRCDRWV